ncbi:atad3-a, partial [Symbiodinium sp. CCMP2456]
MALRLVGHENVCVTSQDVYNLYLLVHHFRGADWAQHVLPFVGFRILSSNCSVAAGDSHTCAISEAGELAAFTDIYDLLPPDLGPVVAVAAGDFHTCAVKASGELVCVGFNNRGQCDVPPDLGPVVAVAAGWRRTCAVKEVLQPVHHEEPAADISEEEGAAIVAEQEASWIEHNIGFGWHGDDLQPRMNAGLTRVVHLTLSRSHRQLDTDLEQSLALQPCRQALQEEGLDWRLQPSGAKIFMEPWCFRAVRSHLSAMRLRPCDIFVSETLENEVMRVIRQIPRSLGVIPRSSQSIAFADEDGEAVLVRRSFLNIPSGMLLSAASVVQSTTE